MDVRRLRSLLVVAALAGPVWAQATRPLVISPETTLVTGPLNPDGTVNYTAAINQILSRGITRENNAAGLIMQATVSEKRRDEYKRMAEVLGVVLPKENSSFVVPESYLEAHALAGTKVDPDAVYNRVQKCTATPWKPADYPELAECLSSQEKSLALLEQAAALPQCYFPWVSSDSTPGAMPSPTPLLQATRILAVRAMLRTGARDFNGAMADLRIMQKLTQFALDGNTELSHLVAIANTVYLMRGFDGMITGGDLPAEQLRMIRKQIEASPELNETNDVATVEEMMALEQVMRVFRGDYQTVIKGAVGISETPLAYDMGDLPKLDCQILLAATRRESRELYGGLSWKQKLQALNQVSQAAKDDGMPGHIFMTDEGRDTKKETVEAYLRMRAGETPEQFAARMVHWWNAGIPETSKRFVVGAERGRFERPLALLAISLAEYHLAHVAYPDALAALGAPVLQDPFSGKEVVYRRQGKGYILYSVGANQTDDKGTGDDRPIVADK